MNNQGHRFSNEDRFANLHWRWAGHLAGRRQVLRGGRPGVRGQQFRQGRTLCGADEVNWRTGMMTLKDKPLENAGQHR
ncbi:MAG: hypothetical protein ACLT98_03410 [Eggerthellaceae bacterium]